MALTSSYFRPELQSVNWFWRGCSDGRERDQHRVPQGLAPIPWKANCLLFCWSEPWISKPGHKIEMEKQYLSHILSCQRFILVLVKIYGLVINHVSHSIFISYVVILNFSWILESSWMFECLMVMHLEFLYVNVRTMQGNRESWVKDHYPDIILKQSLTSPSVHFTSLILNNILFYIIWIFN